MSKENAAKSKPKRENRFERRLAKRRERELIMKVGDDSMLEVNEQWQSGYRELNNQCTKVMQENELLRQSKADVEHNRKLLSKENQKLIEENKRLKNLEVKLWECPDCGFAFDAIHKDDPGGGYSCPHCAEIESGKQLQQLKEELAHSKQMYDQVYDDRERMRSELESHGPEGRNYTNAEYVSLLQERESLRAELAAQESWKAISEMAQRESAELRTELAEKDKVLEWIRDAGTDYQSIQKARDVLLRYKRGNSENATAKAQES